jgi:hypothetical protein
MQNMGARTLSQLVQMAMTLGILKLYDGDESEALSTCA